MKIYLIGTKISEIRNVKIGIKLDIIRNAQKISFVKKKHKCIPLNVENILD